MKSKLSLSFMLMAWLFLAIWLTLDLMALASFVHSRSFPGVRNCIYPAGILVWLGIFTYHLVCHFLTKGAASGITRSKVLLFAGLSCALLAMVPPYGEGTVLLGVLCAVMWVCLRAETPPMPDP